MNFQTSEIFIKLFNYLIIKSGKNKAERKLPIGNQSYKNNFLIVSKENYLQDFVM